MWDVFVTVWQYPLVSLTSGGVIRVNQLVLVAAVLAVGIFVSRRIERLVADRLAERQIQRDAAQALRRLLFYSLIVLVVMTALSLLHVPLTAFAFVSGAVAIGVGFGAQNIVNNFISGWILMWERPVRIDDFVEIDGSFGTVETIGNRSTMIRRTDGVHMLVPNSQMLERTVINWTLIDRHIRTSVRVGVSYGSPAREVQRLLRQAVVEQPDVNPEPQPVVVFDEFGDDALAFEVSFWCDVAGERELRQIRSEIRFRIYELFGEHGIVIAFPQRDVHLDSTRPLRVEVVGDAAAPTTP